MKLRSVSSLFTGLIFLGMALSAQAATWGVEVGVSTLSPCPSFCGGPGGAFGFSEDGGEFSTSAFATLANNDGDGQATASLSGPSMLPVLGAEGFSGANSRTDASAVGMLGYTYTGQNRTSISLDIRLDGKSGGPPADPGWVNSNVAVVRGNVTYFSTHYATFIYEIVPGTPGLSLMGESSMTLSTDGSLDQQSDSIALVLEPGDVFFVWAGVNAGGIRGGYGDAFSTLSMSFSDPAGINTAVPVPAAIWLFGSGLVGLLGINRRRKNAG